MDKKAITEAVLAELKVNYDLDTALKIWWWNDYGGHHTARLTRAGNAAVSKVMRPFTFDCELENSGAGLKRLAKMNTPYYADHRNQQITIYSEQLAMMIRMYDSFDRYLEILNG